MSSKNSSDCSCIVYRDRIFGDGFPRYDANLRVTAMVDHQSIADRLVEEGFLLSALEFHTELLERGRGLKSLKEFFENPSNFEAYTRKLESPVPSAHGLNRSSSQVTLDSFFGEGLGRFSEDSHADGDRLAILEFELRKARDTINSLREEISCTQRRHLPSRSYSEEDDEDYDDISKTELTIINYIINEFLLQHNYKLTSITFSDENSNMDFEEWDSMGLSLKKPPGIVKLYRDYGQHPTPKTTADCATQVDSVSNQIEEMNREKSSMAKIIEQQRHEIDQLKSLVMADAVKEYQDDIVKNENLEEEQEEEEEQIGDAPFQMNLGVHDYFMNTIGVNEIKSYENLSSDLNVVLGDTLPKIVPNVLLAKREELIPLLLAVIENHADPRVRDECLSVLFNLIKKPGKAQRRMIIRGYLSMAKKFGAARLESELLPHCWEQLNHKYPARRTLVAETCSILMPFIPESLRNSLVLSMLQQLVLEDRDTQVKIASIYGLTSLVLHMRTGDKFDLLCKITRTLLNDTELIETTRQSLLLAVALWSHQVSENIDSSIVVKLLDDISKGCDDDDDDLMVSQKIRSLRIVLPVLVSTVLKSSGESSFCSGDLEYNRESSKFEIPASILTKFHSLVSREWFEEWRNLNFLCTEFAQKVLQISSKVLIVQETIVKDLIDLMEDIVHYLGRNLTRRYLQPLSVSSSSSALLAVEILTLSDQAVECLIEKTTTFVFNEVPLDTVNFVFKQMCSRKMESREKLNAEIWTLLVHNDPRIRKQVAIFFSYWVRIVNEYAFLNVRLLPGIVTLAWDPDFIVRRAAISALGLTALNPITLAHHDLTEKVLLQFVALLEDPEHTSNTESVSELIYYLGLIIPVAPVAVRDQVLVKKLSELSAFYSHMSDENERRKMILIVLEAYKNVLQKTSLSQNVHGTYVLPFLLELEADIRHNVPDLNESISYLVRHAQSMAEDPLSPQREQVEKTMTYSPSIDEMKQKMGKFFQKPTWKK